MNLHEMIEMYDTRKEEYFKTGFLGRSDWEVLCRVITKYNLKNIMEFGSGTSTRLFHDCGISCISYEQDQKFAETLQKQCPNNTIVKWNGLNIPKKEYDLIFIDGPWCTPKTIFNSREQAFNIALRMQPKFVAMHDMDCKNERKLRDTVFKSWIQVDQSELTHIVRNPRNR